MLNRLLRLGLVATAMMAVPAACDGPKGSSFLDDLLKNGRKSTENFDPVFTKVGEMIPEAVLDRVSVMAHNVLDNGLPAKVGYGFMVGYSSGYCVKKVSKAIAFTVGAFFMGVQFLASHGYARVNNEKLKEDVEGVMDLNNDGKIDAEDAKLAFSKLNGALSYNMPSGGGFTAGLLMGLRA